MAMPRKLKYMNVFLNGYSYQGIAKSITLPKLTRKLENYRGAGMNGVAPVDALIKVLPRMSAPSLTEQEVAALELPDLVALAGKVIGFLSPNSAQ